MERGPDDHNYAIRAITQHCEQLRVVDHGLNGFISLLYQIYGQVRSLYEQFQLGGLLYV